MKTDPSDPLRRMLQEWREVPVPDAGLAARVLHDVSIGRAGGKTGDGVSPWRFALAGMTLGALLGIAVVEWRENQTESVRAAEMPQVYLAWIDPPPGMAEAKP